MKDWRRLQSLRSPWHLTSAQSNPDPDQGKSIRNWSFPAFQSRKPNNYPAARPAIRALNSNPWHMIPLYRPTNCESQILDSESNLYPPLWQVFHLARWCADHCSGDLKVKAPGGLESVKQVDEWKAEATHWSNSESGGGRETWKNQRISKVNGSLRLAHAIWLHVCLMQQNYKVPLQNINSSQHLPRCCPASVPCWVKSGLRSI